jgi:uncharacterized protein
MSLQLSVIVGRFAVCRLPSDSMVPAWAFTGAISSVTATSDELSIVCDETSVPPNVQHQAGWACFKLHGPFDFNLTGILTAVLNPLRDAGIGIFAMSTYDTDYVMVPDQRLQEAVTALREAGHQVDEPAT